MVNIKAKISLRSSIIVQNCPNIGSQKYDIRSITQERYIEFVI